MRKEAKGFTLIELLIVVAIIGVLAAVAIPNLLAAMSRSRQKRTMADMRNIAMAWESRATETGGYTAAGALSMCCTVEMEIAEIKAVLEPTYINPLPASDGWDRDFHFFVDDVGENYQITSAAKDGIFEEAPAGGATNDIDCDIIYSNGMFIQYPEGLQTQ